MTHRQKRARADLYQPERSAQELDAEVAAVKRRLFTTTYVHVVLTSACHQIRGCRALTVREAESLLGHGERTEHCNGGNTVILIDVDAVGPVSIVATNSNWVSYKEDDRDADADETRPPFDARLTLAELHHFLKFYTKSPEDGQSEEVYIYRC